MELNLYGHKCIVSELEGANARGYYKTIRAAFPPTPFHRHVPMPPLSRFRNAKAMTHLLNMKYTVEITTGHVLQQRYDYQEWCPCPECEGTGQGEVMFWVDDIDRIELILFVPSDQLMDRLEAYILNKNVAILSDACTECLGSGQGITPELSQDESDVIFLDFIFQCGLWALGERID